MERRSKMKRAVMLHAVSVSVALVFVIFLDISLGQGILQCTRVQASDALALLSAV